MGENMLFTVDYGYIIEIIKIKKIGEGRGREMGISGVPFQHPLRLLVMF